MNIESFYNLINMKILKLKKVMKNSNGFLTISVHNHGFYAINESDKLVFHKKGIDITNNIFTTYIKYTEINRLIIE